MWAEFVQQIVQSSPGQPEESPTCAISLSLWMGGEKDLQRGLNPLPACLWGCWRLRWPWELFPCCKKRAAPFTMKKLSLRLEKNNHTGVSCKERAAKWAHLGKEGLSSLK